MAYFHCLIGSGGSGGGYILTVTCDAAFAGTIITCTDGVTTLASTCPSASPYEVEFDIPNGGDWTISGVVSGQTITTGVNIPTTAELIAYVQKTITIYSAKEDTIAYTDVYGDTQTEVFASGQTSKQITVDILVNGSSITFTSGVAKNPTSLSSAYSRTVTVTSDTTDVYLMPDNALYWWGYKGSDLEDCSTANGWTASNQTYDVPTYNTNDITFLTASLKVKAVGSKIQVQNKTVNAIMTGITLVNNIAGQMRLGSKDYFDDVGTVVNVNTTSMARYTHASSATSAYVKVGSSNNMGSKLHALWYE